MVRAKAATADEAHFQRDPDADERAVSYTHLTLPTN